MEVLNKENKENSYNSDLNEPYSYQQEEDEQEEAEEEHSLGSTHKNNNKNINLYTQSNSIYDTDNKDENENDQVEHNLNNNTDLISYINDSNSKEVYSKKTLNYSSLKRGSEKRDSNNQVNKLSQVNQVLDSHINYYSHHNIHNQSQTNNQSQSQNNKETVELLLYDDALKRRERLEKIRKNKEKEMKIKSESNKLTIRSYEISLQLTEKNIDEAIDRITKEKSINKSELNQILHLLEIFNVKPMTKEDLLKKTKVLKENKQIEERRKKEEDFIFQLWKKLSVENEERIDKEIIKDFLKIIMTPIGNGVTTIESITSIITLFINAVSLLVSTSTISNQYNQYSKENKEEWSIERLVKEFINIKSTSSKMFHSKSQLIHKKQVDSKSKFTFKPKITKHLSTEINKMSFEERRKQYESIRLEKKERIEKEVVLTEENECTFQPKTRRKHNKNEFDHERIGEESKWFERLYSKKDEKEEKEKEEENQKRKREKELEGCSFRPMLSQLNEEIFENKLKSREKEAYEKTIHRLQKGIIENFQRKFLSEKINNGENWERVKNMNVKPFDITDLKEKERKEEKNQEEHVLIEVDIAKGKKRLLKIRINEDPLVIADNFCKVYSLKEEIRNRLVDVISQFQIMYIEKKEKEKEKKVKIIKN